MNLMTQVIRYIMERQDIFLLALYEHAYITVIASVLSGIVGLLLGILITRMESLRGAVLGTVSLLYTIPALSLFFFLIPLMGIGTPPAITALFIYGLLPIVQNTYVGIEQVNPAIKEAARGMGTSDLQLLTRVELPLAFPVIFAGIKNMVVMNIAIATIAVFVGAGGLGNIILKGIRTFNDVMMISGTLIIALVAILVERVFALIDYRLNRSRFGK